MVFGLGYLLQMQHLCPTGRQQNVHGVAVTDPTLFMFVSLSIQGVCCLLLGLVQSAVVCSSALFFFPSYFVCVCVCCYSSHSEH